MKKYKIKNIIELNSLFDFALILIIIYFFLYTFPFPFYYFPFGLGQAISSWVNDFWSSIVIYYSENYLENPIKKVRNGSADTTFDFAKFFVQLTFSFCLAISIFFVERIRRFFLINKLLFIYYLRFYLGFILMGYALSKIFYLQFWEPTLSDLIQPYGESSRMGVLWKFMGLSEGYSIFTGLLQFFSGFFLLFSKTYKIGALGSFGILLNIVALNIFFDVPVKLFSLHLLFAAIILIAHDYKQYISFFILSSNSKPIFKRKSYSYVFLTFKFGLIIYFLLSGIDSRIERQKRFGKRAPSHALYGVYHKIDVSVQLKDSSLNNYDVLAWKTLIMDKRSSTIIKDDDSKRSASHEIDTTDHKLIVIDKKSDVKYEFLYQLKDSALVLVSRDSSLKLSFERIKREDFPLMTYEMKWINEYPNNK